MKPPVWFCVIFIIANFFSFAKSFKLLRKFCQYQPLVPLLDKLTGTSDMKKVKDLKERPLLLFVNEWSIRMTQERNEGLILTEFAK